MVSVKGIVCPKCGDFIYSRAHYDYHSCSCGEVSIDGGFDYMRILNKSKTKPVIINKNINATKKQLYDDWNEDGKKYGVIKPKLPPVFTSTEIKGEKNVKEFIKKTKETELKYNEKLIRNKIMKARESGLLPLELNLPNNINDYYEGLITAWKSELFFLQKIRRLYKPKKYLGLEIEDRIILLENILE